MMSAEPSSDSFPDPSPLNAEEPGLEAERVAGGEPAFPPEETPRSGERARSGPAAPGGDASDRLATAALELAAEGAWAEPGLLRRVAERAGLSASELYMAAPGREALIDLVSRRFDAAAFAAGESGDGDPGDRLFDALMARLEAMEPHRTALQAIVRAEGPPGPQAAARLARTLGALLEAAGLDRPGRVGAVRRAALLGVWLRVLWVWRDDEGALNRSMAEIDRRIKTLRRRLSRVNAGF